MPSDPFRILHRTARRQLGLFLVGQATGSGLSHEALRSLRRRGLVVRLNRHVYEIAGTPDSRRKRMLAASLAAGPHAALSHSSAAWLHGLFDIEPQGIEVLFPRDRNRRVLPGARVRTSRTFEPDRDTTTRGPFHLTDVPRTLCDLAGVLDEAVLRRVVLHTLRHRLTKVEALAARLGALGRMAGGPGLRSILEECDPQVGRTRSTWEAEALVLVRRAGVAAPVVNLVLEHPDGTPRYELDLAWPHLRFAYELQSRIYHTLRADALKDERKLAELRDEGWTIEPIPLDLIRHHPHRFVERVRADIRAIILRTGDGSLREV